MYKNSRSIVSVIIILVLVFSFTVLPPTQAHAAMPTLMHNRAYDGVDFSANVGGLNNTNSFVYLGSHTHPLALQNGTFGNLSNWETTPTPVLWQVAGEEGGKGLITLRSSYVVDSLQFFPYINPGYLPSYNYVNRWETSRIKAWLNNESFTGKTFGTTGSNGVLAGPAQNFASDGFLETFLAAEKNALVAPSKMHLVEAMYSVPVEALEPLSKLWLPSSKANGISWAADLTSGFSPSLPAVANLKKASGSGVGPAVQYWLRAPNGNRPDEIQSIAENGQIWGTHSNIENLGVLPMTMLNPNKVVYAAEISATPKSYQARADSNMNKYLPGASGKKAFKLTLLGDNGGGTNPYTLNNLKYKGNAVTSSSTFTVDPGANISLTGRGNVTSNTSVNYKIVQSIMGKRELVGYGTGVATGAVNGSEQNITIAAKDLDGAALEAGEYSVYVWLQKNNTINSNEASEPLCFKIYVSAGASTGAPVITRKTTTIIIKGTDATHELLALGDSPFTWSVDSRASAIGVTIRSGDAPYFSPDAGLLGINTTTIPLGTYKFNVICTDKFNLQTTKEFTLIVVDDDTSPKVSVDINGITLLEGETYKANATVASPDEAAKALYWYSYDKNVASVDQSGNITAVGPGDTQLLVRTLYSSLHTDWNQKTINVHVKPYVPVSGISLDASTAELKIGESKQLTATVMPGDASIKTVVWSSSDGNIANVDANGKVTAVSAGTATIRAVSKDGNMEAACLVTVKADPALPPPPPPPTQPADPVPTPLPTQNVLPTLTSTPTIASAPVIKVSSVKTLSSLYLVKGKTATLPFMVYPKNAKNKSVTWSTSNKKYVTVDSKTGKIKGIKNGKSTITIKSKDGGKTFKCTVYVASKTATLKSIVLSKRGTVRLAKGKTLTLVAKASPSKATGFVPVWKSSNTKVASVDKTGKITAVAKGTATITVYTGSKKATVKIQVINAAASNTAFD